MKVLIGVIMIAALAVGGIFFLRNDKAPSSATEVVSTLSTFASISSEVSSGIKLYDVRTPEEYAEGRFPGSTNLPLQDIQAGKLPDTSKDAKLYVYCRSGNRSAEATDLLKQAGFTNVVDLGGLSDVQKLGGKLTKE